MATPAQIAANRRNAARSTGPKTARGKAASSRNATTHGLTAAIASDDIRRRAEIIAAEFPAERWEDKDPARALRLLKLAQAEARLERARKAEREILAKGDDELRLAKELKMIHELLSDDQEVWRSLSRAEVLEGALLGLRVSKAGTDHARRTYARLRRHLREAEAEHRAALRAWLEAQ